MHNMLYEIFGSPKSKPFVDLSIIVVRNLLQFPPIKSSQIFGTYNNAFGDLFHLVSLFVLVELTEVVLQKGDENFINLLNNNSN